MGQSRNWIVSASLLLSFVLAGCAAGRTAGWQSEVDEAKLSSSQETQLLAEARKLWTTRHIQADLQNALAKLERVASSNSENLEALTLLSRGYYLLADGHLENMDEKKKNWETGISWGERALATNAEFRKLVVDEKKNPEEALDTLKPEHTAAIYWTAVNLGKWAKNSGIGTTLKYKTRIRMFIEKVAALQPDFFFGAVPRYWAVYYAVAPGFAGGSIEKSKENFDKTLQIAPNYLASHVLLAENYATKKGDKDLFRKELEFVLNTKPESLPPVASENILEQKKAKKMLENLESYF